MIFNRFFYSLLGFAAVLSPSAGLVFAGQGSTGSKQVITIPVKVTSKVFYPKPKEEVPKKFPAKVYLKVDAGKVGLVYPQEIYLPKERVKVDRGFFSCGGSDDKELYAKALKALEKGEYFKAKGYFLRLINEYPQSPFAIKARYYLGYIAFKVGNYREAYRIFKNLCNSPYNFQWKSLACYNAVISGLYLGIHDKQAAASSTFWSNYLNWLEGKVSDDEFYRSLNCDGLLPPYRNYCYYLREYLKPTSEVTNLPPQYRESLQIKRLILGLISGFTGVNYGEVAKYFNDPKYGKEIEYFYTLYLINRGNFQQALKLIEDLKRKDPKRAEELAELLASYGGPNYAYLAIKLFPSSNKLWEIYLKELYNAGYYSTVLNYAPNLGFYRLAGYAAYQIGNYKLAAQYLERVERKNITDYRVLLDSLIRLKEGNRLLKDLSEVKNVYPNLYREFLGWYYYYRGNWTKAAALLKEPFYKAVAYFNTGYYDKALHLLRNYNDPQARILKAKIYLAKGRFSEAIETLKGLNIPEAYYLLGLAYFAEGNYREAARYFSKLLDRIDKYPDALLKLADSYYNLGEYNYAKHYYLEFLRLFPKSGLVKDAYLGLANIYLQTGDIEIAELLYRVVKQNPSLVGDGLKLKLAEGFIKNGEYKKAKELLQGLLKSSDPYYKGRALLLLAQLEENKIEYLKEALKNPLPQIRSEAAVKLVEYYISTGDRKKALETLERLEKEINNPDKLVELYTKLGAYDRLYYLLRELIAADNKYTLVAYKIAKDKGRWEFYKLAVYSLDPKVAADSAYHLEKHYLAKGDLKEALKYALYLKMKNLKVEPYYSKAMFDIVEALAKKGYTKDACSLIGEINPKYLSTDQKLELESIKVSCGS